MRHETHFVVNLDVNQIDARLICAMVSTLVLGLVITLVVEFVARRLSHRS